MAKKPGKCGQTPANTVHSFNPVAKSGEIDCALSCVNECPKHNNVVIYIAAFDWSVKQTSRERMR